MDTIVLLAPSLSTCWAYVIQRYLKTSFYFFTKDNFNVFKNLFSGLIHVLK